MKRGPRESAAVARLADRRPPGSVTEPPAPPDTLPEQAHGAWHDLAAALAEAGALVESDHLLLGQLAVMLTMAREYGAKLLEGLAAGETTELDRNGGEHVVPFAGSRREKRLRSSYMQAVTRLESLADAYGLNPTSRVRLGLDRVMGSSLLEALQRSRREAE